MDYNFVFQDNLQVMVRQNDVENKTAIPDNVLPPDISYYLGNHCLVAVGEHWIPGRLLLEDDEEFYSSIDPGKYGVLRFPVADYFFTSGEIMISQVTELEKDSIVFLQNNNIGIQDFSIVVFPNEMPINDKQKVLAEFWLATNADVRTDRLSDNLPEVLGKKRFDFFRS